MGTDSITRSIENLLAKTLSLNEEGITAFCLTGSYAYPTTTITGSISKDIAFLDHVIGLKIAANDHRDSAIQPEELARIASESRVAGMISGKSGHVTVHMGNGKFNFDQIEKALEISNLPRSIFRPTHVNRTKELFDKALEFSKKGGYIDLTSCMNSNLKDLECYKLAKSENILDKISFSTDGFGSWSKYDDLGNLIEIGYSPLDSSIKSFKEIVENGENIEDVIKVFSTNIAKALKLNNKGELKKEKDADILILDNNLSILSVICKGKFLKKDGEILIKGTYE